MADDEGNEDVGEEQQPEAYEDDALSPVPVQPLDPPKYEVRPGLGDKFQAENIHEIIVTSMQQQLSGRQYRADQAPHWAQMIANGVRQRTQELGMKRYKILVQAVILEMKGAGIKMGQRCLWDPETDDYVHGLYKDGSIMCHCTVYGIYMY
ncbi:dynein light chain Tctex-type protein 2B-like [Cydia pomonella]|uniref:dynein light chain Tctex-type protein 2B-like n=1 Tax=Cydia pomonella TaxID=82600 RepID=UPI002ADDA23A|nr:dynein light chain Tctex-type protein 2B-like [Cydia pomonella]XP_061716721.1 dynein light chain Tctex-type protein 2B-like [Cydia pomonella]XP_061716730.1 dynein light chain Tctex-type protein 2B-like [Cydia pomonella]